MGKKVGYARVSSDDQNLSLQKDELKALGCSIVFSDKASGVKSERKGLVKCLNTLEKGDTLVVWRLDRLGRSMPHLVAVITDLKERGIHFKSIHDGVVDTTSASGELIFNVFAALAQFERQLIRERTRAGLKAARARGRLGGRKPILPNNQRVKMAKKLHADKSNSIDDICFTLKISKSTLYRYLSL